MSSKKALMFSIIGVVIVFTAGYVCGKWNMLSISIPAGLIGGGFVGYVAGYVEPM